ncbi:MAG: hypothetical protein ACREFQ_16315 [Stellaceae bacterium]
MVASGICGRSLTPMLVLVAAVVVAGALALPVQPTSGAGRRVIRIRVPDGPPLTAMTPT